MGTDLLCRSWVCRLLAFVLLAGAHGATAIGESEVRFEVSEQGLSRLSYDGEDRLWDRRDGAFAVTNVTLRALDGTTSEGDTTEIRRQLTDERAVSVTYPWGNVVCRYEGEGSTLRLVVDVTNTSDAIISEIGMTQRGLSLPEDVEGLVMERWRFGFAYGVEQPPIMTGTWDGGSFAFCNDQVYRPLGIGVFNRDREPDFRLDWWTGHRFQDHHPTIERPIFPQQTERFVVSMRFGPADSHPLDLTEDVLATARKVHPYQVGWPDRRPIGMLMLAQSGKQTPENPRGYRMLIGEQDVDLTTDSGQASFKEKLLEMADQVIELCEEIDAQGVVVWDIEGVEFPRAKYMGDPRSLPPEMEEAADAFFAKLKEAGLRTGVCLRWGVRPMRWSYSDEVRQFLAPEPTKDMIYKIRRARERWGCELFYMDVFPADRPDALQQIKRAHPDVLLLPEHEGVYSYAYGIPYHQVYKSGRQVKLPDMVRRLYPQAGRLLNGVGMALNDERRPEAVEAIEAGSIPMARVWFRGREFAPLRELMKHDTPREAALTPLAR